MKQLLLLLFSAATLCAAGVSNRFTITKAAFNPDNFTVAMSWTFDTSGIQGTYQGGIRVNPGNIPDSIPNFLIYFETSLLDTTFFIPELQFDTAYTFSIWMKNESGWIAPDSHSIRTLQIETTSRQPVEFFDQGKAFDTVSIFKKSVFFWKDSDYPLGIPPHIDTVVSYTPELSHHKGLTLAGPGIRFLHPEHSLPFYIGFKIDTNKFSGAFTRIFTDSSGLYRAQENTFYDSEHSIVYTVTNKMNLPFVVLTDTIRPVIQVLSDTTSVIGVDPISDTILVRDNCPGVRWGFFCLSDEDTTVVRPVASGIIPDTSGLIICQIPFWEFSKNGARAFLVITDGTFQDTVDLSRRSICEAGDIISTESNFITPVFTTVDIDSPGVRSALKTLFQLSGGKLNNSIFRLYQWASSANNASSTNKWLELSSENESSFQFTPSALFWLITKQSVIFELGKGKTPPLRDDFVITLPPKNWTDFSIPYSFGISLADVIKATGTAASDIHYYRWEKNDSVKSYSANLMFSKAVNGDSYGNIVFSSESSGYTAYNPFDTALQLHFPIYSFGQSVPEPVLSKKAADASYSIAVNGVAQNGTATTVWCAAHQGSNILFCPQPPSFSTPCVSILQGENEMPASVVSCPSGNTASLFKLYVPKTSGNRVTLSAAIVNSSYSTQFCFLRKNNNGFTIAGNDFVEVNPENESVLYLAAAEKTTLEKMYPILPIQNAVSDHLPFKFGGNKITFHFSGENEQHAVVEFFNLQGKRVLKSVATRLEPSINLMLTSGVYIAKFSTIMDKSKQSFVQYQKFSIGR